MAVDLPVHASDANSTMLCFLIQSGLYSENNIALAKNDAAELLDAFASRSADDVYQEFLGMRLLHPDLCTLEIIQRMKDGRANKKSDSADAHTTANGNSQFAQEQLMPSLPPVSQGPPDDDAT